METHIGGTVCERARYAIYEIAESDIEQPDLSPRSPRSAESPTGRVIPSSHSPVYHCHLEFMTLAVDLINRESSEEIWRMQGQQRWRAGPDSTPGLSASLCDGWAEYILSLHVSFCLQQHQIRAEHKERNKLASSL
jgi:hypothetical protein